MQDRSIVIGENKDGTDLTLGAFCDMIQQTCEEVFKKHGMKKKVKVGALMIKEEGF